MNYFIKTDFFNPELTLTGGQAFRWERLGGGRYGGVAGNKYCEIAQKKDGVRLIFSGDKDLPFWLNYFDTDRDYEEAVICFSKDKTLRKACEYARGLRLLRQEPFETLISFIISQCNNIPRIKGIIKRLCESFGEEIGKGIFAFPTAERLVEADLSVLRAGFREKYIKDAAQKAQNGEIDLNALYEYNTEKARKTLTTISGVGEKVADCVLLFAYGKADAFPKDTWIKKAMLEFYPDGLPACIKGHEGLAQQYLFEYIRNRKD